MYDQTAHEPRWTPDRGPVPSVAAAVSRAAGGYGAWPLAGTCAAQMRQQNVSGVSISLNEPFHGGYPYMAGMINWLIAQFVRTPATFASGGSLVTHHGEPVVNRLCKEAEVNLSATNNLPRLTLGSWFRRRCRRCPRPFPRLHRHPCLCSPPHHHPRPRP